MNGSRWIFLASGLLAGCVLISVSLSASFECVRAAMVSQEPINLLFLGILIAELAVGSMTVMVGYRATLQGSIVALSLVLLCVRLIADQTSLDSSISLITGPLFTPIPSVGYRVETASLIVLTITTVLYRPSLKRTSNVYINLSIALGCVSLAICVHGVPSLLASTSRANRVSPEFFELDVFDGRAIGTFICINSLEVEIEDIKIVRSCGCT